jgi:predicted helicase
MTKAEIFYKDIGDYLSREEKLKIVKEAGSILSPALEMTQIKPNEHGDWISMRNSKFDEFIPLEPENKFDNKTKTFFTTYAIGVSTNRDAWVYNFSENSLKGNMKKMIAFYNEQRKLVEKERKKNPELNFEDYLDSNPQKISWTVNLKKDLENNITHKFNENVLVTGLYRPFVKMNLFFDHGFIERPGIWSQLLPTDDGDNLIICISCVGTNNGLSVLICDKIPNLHFAGDTQCFPLYWYEKKEKVQGSLFEKIEDEYTRHDAISDFILEQAKTRYGPKVIKEDIFYYVYGILYSPDYRKTFGNDLKKILPRLPLVEKVADFWAFSKAGRNLADIHLNYEEQEPPREVLINGKSKPKTPFPANQLAVNKMSFPSKGQKDTIIYNSYLTVSNIPAKAYEYIVNGKSAIEWVMERYAVTTHKESGITNDPNDWALEHGNPQYILDLLLSVITVSIKTVDIVAGLPKVEWK